MTNEEAIVQLEIDATNLVGRLASEPVHDTSFSELLERKLEAIDIAIYAVKMFDKHEAECERCACNLLAERDVLKEEKLISNADVAQVVRGWWVEIGRNSHDYETSIEEKCSLCGRYVYRYDTQPQDNYCPNCGAKMVLDGKDDNE